MKTNRIAIGKYLAIMIACIVVSCSQSQRDKKAVSEEWLEMESFHMLMAEAYHPYMDSANLTPARALADSLASESARWASSTIPAPLNAEDVKPKLDALKASCHNLALMIEQNATDDQVSAALKNPTRISMH